ncbi:BatA and WFA domain-containing protein [Candidatus Woesearchaeota archaeon]|nr:BatA and WFA domain-containing protein [Candidatus Woesearchaeota archaeon]
MVEYLNSIGKWALLALIPFIILYLRKPKPQDRIIPSLMFILQDKKQSKRSAIFRRFIANFLFFLQLLALIGLVYAVMEPSFKVPYDVSLENTIIVLDASASMQAEDGGKTRFEEAIKEANKVLSGRNSIILAEHIPLVVLEEEDISVAADILGSLKPKATITNLGDAMLLAKDMLGERPGRIVVISDFNSVDGSDLLVVKRTLSSEEIIINFIDVSNDAENAGITSLDLRKHSIKIYVKNFNTVNKQITLKLIKDKKSISESGKITVLPNSVETFIFDDVPTGLSEIQLEPKDDLMVDNTVYLSAPLKSKVNVLLITNKRTPNIQDALLASRDISLNVVNPPVLTVNTQGKKIEPFQHDVIVLHEINNVGRRDGILPGTFKDISNFVKQGGKLIITAQDDLDKFAREDLDIVELKKLQQSTQKVCMDVINELTKDFANNNCFATTSKYFSTTAKKDTITIASIQGIPAFAVKDHYKGKIFYYGIMDEASDFSSLPAYPIFWNSLINFMEGTEDVRDFNTKTGRIITINEQKVKTPSSSLTTSKVIFDEAGIYNFNGKNFAANLLDASESDVTKLSVLEAEGATGEVLSEQGVEKNFSISPVILILVFILLLYEVWYVKRRGDL